MSPARNLAMQNTTSRILLTGGSGQVGRELQKNLTALGHVLTPDRHMLDLANPDTIRKIVRDYQPNLIINAAAYTAVDRAESEPDLSMAVNGIAPGVLAEEAQRLNAVLLHYSTDYVFDGTKATAYTETDLPNPISVYGKTKLFGEQAIQSTNATHYILRTSWVYSAQGANFLNTILRLALERQELRIVDDQIGAPTWASSIAKMTMNLVDYAASHRNDPRHGLYHLTAAGAVTWFGFAQAIFAEAAKLPGHTAPRLIPITTAEYPQPARRPGNSRLDTSRLTKTFNINPATWQHMLEKCMQEKLPRNA